MTKPIYFPHTYLPPATADDIRSAFAAVVGYRPVAGRLSPDMRALAESGFLEIVAPGTEDEERLERVLQEFERWGRLQQGGAGLRAVFQSGQTGADPLMEDGTAAQIASEVRRRPTQEPPAHAVLMRAAIFLQLAHQADEQAHQVREELGRSERAHADLLEALTGEASAPAEEFLADSHVPMVPEADLLLEHRLKAWALLFGQRPYASPVFVTASLAVISLLAEKFPTMLRIGRSTLTRMACERRSSAPPPQGDLMAGLEILASRPLPDPIDSDEGPDAPPAVYVVPDTTPQQLFARLAENEGAAGTVAVPPDWRHTVIVNFSPPGPLIPPSAGS